MYEKIRIALGRRDFLIQQWSGQSSPSLHSPVPETLGLATSSIWLRAIGPEIGAALITSSNTGLGSKKALTLKPIVRLYILHPSQSWQGEDANCQDRTTVAQKTHRLHKNQVNGSFETNVSRWLNLYITVAPGWSQSSLLKIPIRPPPLWRLMTLNLDFSRYDQNKYSPLIFAYYASQLNFTDQSESTVKTCNILSGSS